MSKTKLGRLEPADLREAWVSEPGAFTPWLAMDENLTLLGETLGLRLECEAQEKSIGPFRADILCKDVDTGSWVLIENQLERTDHTHLGQLLTYAAGLQAVTIIWIAAEFSEEHRAALDWLNEITDDRICFFGVEIELWRIGDSPMAPKFSIISKPNDWSKSISSQVNRGDSPAKREYNPLRFDFWSGFSHYMSQHRNQLRPAKPVPWTTVHYPLGRSGIYLWSYVNDKEPTLGVGLTCGGANGKECYHVLKQQRGEIEAGIKESLNWEEQPDSKSSMISLYARDLDPNDQSSWERQYQWLHERLGAFHKVFGPRVQAM